MFRTKLKLGTAGLIAVSCVAGGTAVATAPAATASPHKVLLIPFENHSRAQVLAGMPYLVSLGNTYGQASNYSAITHPSLPNYLAMVAGSTFGITTDCSVGSSGCIPFPPSVQGQTLAAGETAKVYAESMPANCATWNTNWYAPRHVPWPYFTDPTERAGCNANDVYAGTAGGGAMLTDVKNGALPVTGEFIPNLCNDAHNCSLATADGWLKAWIPIILAGPDFKNGNLTVIIAFDEGTSTDNNVYLAVLDPRLHGVTVTTAANHYALCGWLERNAGVTLLNNAATAPDLRQAFGLS